MYVHHCMFIHAHFTTQKCRRLTYVSKFQKFIQPIICLKVLNNYSIRVLHALQLYKTYESLPAFILRA